MKLPVAYFKPKPGPSPLDFTKKPVEFSKQFKYDTKKISFSNKADVLALALDSGYGILGGTDQATYLGLTASLQQRLRSYLRTRLMLLWSLLQFDSTSNRILRHQISNFLDSTEKGDASFILGSLASRRATEIWFDSMGPKLKRFWHVSVYTNPVVARMALSIWAGKGKSRPDFIAQDANGSWYAIEAKGSFDEMSWDAVKPGLRQASRLQAISNWDTSSNKLLLNSVQEYACSMAHFRPKTHRLLIAFVDPPNQSDIVSVPGEASPSLDVEFVYELAQLSHMYQACVQFKLVGKVKRNINPVINQIGGYEWRALVDLGNGEVDAWIGIHEDLLKKETDVRDLLRIMSFVTPKVDDQLLPSFGRENTSLEVDEHTWRAWVKDFVSNLTKVELVGITVRQKRLFYRLITELNSERFIKPMHLNWHCIMQGILDLRVIVRGRDRTSIRNFVEEFQAISHAGYVATLDFELKKNKGKTEEASPIQIHFTSHGLLVAS